MSIPQTYLARWYVDGTADIALVCEYSEELAEEVARHNLERMGVTPDRGKVRMKRFEDEPMSFLLLSHGGHA